MPRFPREAVVAVTVRACDVSPVGRASDTLAWKHVAFPWGKGKDVRYQKSEFRFQRFI